MKEIFRVKDGETVVKVDVLTLNPKTIILIVTDKAVYTEEI